MKNLSKCLVVLLALTLGQQVLANKCLPTVYPEFSSDLMSFTAHSTKDISNVVVFLEDGTEKKYDSLSGYEFSGSEDQSITKICIKSGCNGSDEGPGYGECFDACPALSVTSISDVTLEEGSSRLGTPTTSFDFVVTLDGTVPNASCAVSIDYTTVDGTAEGRYYQRDDNGDLVLDADGNPFVIRDGEDYHEAIGTLVIGAGADSGTISVTVNGDNREEADETFTVEISSDVPVQDSSATGTILNDDRIF